MSCSITFLMMRMREKRSRKTNLVKVRACLPSISLFAHSLRSSGVVYFLFPFFESTTRIGVCSIAPQTPHPCEDHCHQSSTVDNVCRVCDLDGSVVFVVAWPRFCTACGFCTGCDERKGHGTSLFQKVATAFSRGARGFETTQACQQMRNGTAHTALCLILEYKHVVAFGLLAEKPVVATHIIWRLTFFIF